MLVTTVFPEFAGEGVKVGMGRGETEGPCRKGRGTGGENPFLKETLFCELFYLMFSRMQVGSGGGANSVVSIQMCISVS
jgi:hypothetical protein